LAADRAALGSNVDKVLGALIDDASTDPGLIAVLGSDFELTATTHDIHQRPYVDAWRRISSRRLARKG